MKKRTLCFLAAALLLLSVCGPAQAAEPWALNAVPSLSFSGTTANCSVTIRDLGKSISATLELWQGGSLVDSWPASGTSVVTITGSCAVVKGLTYTLKVTGTSGGVAINCTPVTGTC